MLCMYNSVFGCALLWDRTTTLISRRDEQSIMLCYWSNFNITSVPGRKNGKLVFLGKSLSREIQTTYVCHTWNWSHTWDLSGFWHVVKGNNWFPDMAKTFTWLLLEDYLNKIFHTLKILCIITNLSGFITSIIWTDFVRAVLTMQQAQMSDIHFFQ